MALIRTNAGMAPTVGRLPEFTKPVLQATGDINVDIGDPLLQFRGSADNSITRCNLLVYPVDGFHRCTFRES